MTLCSAALDYAAKGWRVFPCRPTGDHAKAPLTRSGFHDATTDPDTIRDWWGRWPTALIGAPVPDKLIVIDVDPRNGGDTSQLGHLPRTLRCWSGRGDGGVHMYFRRPAAEISGRRLPRGIDLKKPTGYCIVPPSPHPATGEPYRWDPHPVAELPSALLETLRVVPTVRPTTLPRGDGKSLVAFVAGQVEGNRNNALFWAACRAAEDGVLDELADDLIRTAISIGISDTSARAQIESARRTVVAA